jgi:hypothetical protein
MFDPFNDEHHNSWIPFTDFMAGVLAVFLVVAGLLLFHLQDPNTKTKEGDIHSPGTVMVETFWKPDCDVDTWVKSPDDIPVGYSRKSGKYFDLLRDDLGMEFERAAGMHHENVYSRNAPPGEYIVNLHMYSSRSLSEQPYPFEVEVIVQVVRPAEDGTTNPPTKTVIKTKISIDHEGEEVTVVRFQLDDKANVVPGSISHEQIPIRTGYR